ncbi:flagellar basal-body rod protein FlgC [Alkalibaculum bacchi]|uniref:Flagellar basal-body rod protein FlgC n=1 Tax=Alkalibaculum bacchi TaxID=645887 RepID=A0A366IH10_9FIRM|nr:flagellar basal body rod protein FlgC [Alkalibaculum bacchi]RBP70110.1 flagellar basal-body rod protein FlgC [Alkalibaculum bacchi]
MSVFNSMQINASGLALERLKMDTISTNIANVNTTRTEEGGPYLRKDVVFEEKLRTEISKVTGRMEKKSAGVRVVGIAQDEENLEMVYNPSHPDANEEGYVMMPNVNMVDEMIHLISTQRAYEANVTALNTSKSILKKALEISKG